MFKTIKLEGEWWGVFIVNPTNEKDRYLLTSPLDKKKDAEHFQTEFTRLAAVKHDE